MTEYTQQEIDLARRIYDATMLVSDGITIRRAKNIAKKVGLPPPPETPDSICLETARKLLKHYEDEMERMKREVAERM